MKVNLKTLLKPFEEKEARILSGAFTNRGLSSEEKEAGIAKLRKSKPKRQVKSLEDGCINYIHRWIQFDLGVNDHFPVTDVFDLMEGLEYGKMDHHELSVLTQKRFMDQIPLENQHGIIRWAKILQPC